MRIFRFLKVLIMLSFTLPATAMLGQEQENEQEVTDTVIVIKPDSLIKNRFGIGIVPMLATVMGSETQNCYNLDYYKKTGTKNAIHFGLFYNMLSNNYRLNTLEKLSDTSLVSNEFRDDDLFIGLKLGYERRNEIRESYFLYFGVDILFAGAEYSRYDRSKLFELDTAGTYSFYDVRDQKIESWRYYRLGISPSIGIMYKFNSYFSIAGSIDIDFYSKYLISEKDFVKELYLDEYLSVRLNYHF